jgi:hypothetical protein
VRKRTTSSAANVGALIYIDEAALFILAHFNLTLSLYGVHSNVEAFLGSLSSSRMNIGTVPHDGFG